MSFTGVLRDYQTDAAERMLDRGRVLVAYPQGAGKTPLTIYVIEELREEFGPGFAGIVIATGLKQQWADAIAQFTGGREEGTGRRTRWVGGSDVVVVHGSKDKRAEAYQRILDERPLYAVIGYEQVVTDYEIIRQLPRDYLVGDEITAIKTPSSARSQAVKSLDAPFVYGLTGDPIENGKPEEVFSIMEWVDDGVFGPAHLFDQAFIVRHPKLGFPVRYRNLRELHRRLEPAMVRISEDDPRLARYMPRSNDIVVHAVRLDEASADVYDYIVGDLLTELAEAVKLKRSFSLDAVYGGRGDPQVAAAQGRIMSCLGSLRMLCDDPQILIDSAERYANAPPQPMVWKSINGKRIRVKRTPPGSAYAAKLLRAGVLDKLDFAPKFEAVCRRIDELLKVEENKLIVFAHYKDVLRGFEREYGDVAVTYHGDLSTKVREENKRAFQREPSVRIFLSSDAGGYGVDLPQANYLLNVDKPYAAGRTRQRNTRHRRASSEWAEIHVEDFLVRGSVEEFYAAKTDTKMLVAGAIIDDHGADRRGRITVTAQSLRDYLLESSVR